MGSQVRARNTHSALSAFQEKKIIASLGELRGALEKMFDISLPAPCFARGCDFLPSIKKFCGGLLDTSSSHLWRSSIRRLTRSDRLSVAGSLFLFRKVLPSPDPDLLQYMDKMSIPSDEPDSSFLTFVESKLSKMFHRGWDRSYAGSVLRFSPSTSSCFEKGRKEGGCRGMSTRGEWLSRFDAVEFCLSSPSPRVLGPSRVCSVDTGGKKRIISIPPADMNLLRPLHVTMYDYLSRFPWLLRGDAKPSKLPDFTEVEGEWFVSGDYESATDNLNQKLQQFILQYILDRCEHVPQGIRSMAVSSLSCGLVNRDGTKKVVQCRGQLMGNLISFPLLCLVNFLAFKYSVRRNVPLRINGDDIVFRCTAEERDRWIDQVGRSGLKLSHGKTMVDRKFFSLNSTFFSATPRRCRLVPVIRSTALGLGMKGDLDSLHGRFSSFARGFGRRKREILHCLFLRKNSGMIHATNRSLTRGLGIRVSFDVLVKSRMWARESFYLSMVRERPLPPKKGDISWDVRVPGWSRVYGSMSQSDQLAQKDYAGESVDLVWSNPPVSAADLGKKYWEEALEGTYSFSTWLSERKSCVRRWSRLMRVGRSELKVLFKPRRSLFERSLLPVRKNWFFLRDVGRSRRNIKFVASRER